MPETYRVLYDASELMNTPRIGCPENVCFSGCQLNLAHATYYEDSESYLKIIHSSPQHIHSDLGLLAQLPFFGEEHIDKKDTPTSYTVMISFPDVPDNYEGGRLHLLELGIFIQLDGMLAAGFCGLRYHCGTPPGAPQGKEVLNAAYRWVVVLYPQSAVLEGSTSFNVGAKPDHSPEQVTPEMRNIG